MKKQLTQILFIKHDYKNRKTNLGNFKQADNTDYNYQPFNYVKILQVKCKDIFGSITASKSKTTKQILISSQNMSLIYSIK